VLVFAIKRSYMLRSSCALTTQGAGSNHVTAQADTFQSIKEARPLTSIEIS